jgi:hypothetical protein
MAARRLSLAGSTKQSQTKLEEDEKVKVTFELGKTAYARLRNFAFHAEKSHRDVLTEALNDYLAKHTGPPLKPAPSRRRQG